MAATKDFKSAAYSLDDAEVLLEGSSDDAVAAEFEDIPVFLGLPRPLAFPKPVGKSTVKPVGVALGTAELVSILVGEAVVEDAKFEEEEEEAEEEEEEFNFKVNFSFLGAPLDDEVELSSVCPVVSVIGSV